MPHAQVDELWQTWERAFLALTVWREARGEHFDGKVAVVHTVLNRVTHPGWWGNTITGVLRKKWQYSSLTDPKDPQLTKFPDADDDSFTQCLVAVAGVQEGLYKNPVPGADSYYDVSIPPPKWATPETFVGKIGRLVFHNVDGDVEGPPLPKDP